MTETAELQDFLGDIATSVALGMVPFLGQAIDIYDTLHAAYDLYTSSNASQEAKEEVYFDLALAAIGWIPGPGDGIKHTLKTINKNPKKYAPLLLDAVRQALYAAGYKVDPHQFLMDSISQGKIREIINGVKSDIAHSSVYKRCDPHMQQAVMIGIDMAAQSLPMVVGIVERKVQTWLKVNPKSTAAKHNTAPVHEAKSAPPAQVGNKKSEVGSQGKANPAKVLNGTLNAAEIAIVNLPHNQKQESIGEHVADYYCDHELGWGNALGGKSNHDKGHASKAKLTDRAKMSVLDVEIKARGVGIDAIWRTGQVKPYAVAEYKTRDIGLSEQGMKSLLVRESAQDADKKAAHRKKVSEFKKAEKNSAKTGQAHGLSKPELEREVPKMSHKWIKDRVEKRLDLGGHKDALMFQNKYTRHVIQVVTSKGDGKAHKDELNKALEEQRAVVEGHHPAHKAGIDNFTNAFTEAPQPQSQVAPNQAPTNSGRRKK
ncbi:hypothetical protein KIK84_16180 [Curvibacter sp. CHRR-16]|uniref:hypothetical protein n=1 Tax=Curvibacter sp. CHRR-16 TaxID=2835872 RepID=UPI001BDA3C64|nr:hypothetical protein [Curvibacter sp. CHRR-16]MBT0571854.1 hypothetical protein [Curvibacter sp. CHRR-16]